MVMDSSNQPLPSVDTFDRRLTIDIFVKGNKIDIDIFVMV